MLFGVLLAAFLAFTSAFSLGWKSLWLGTHWNHRSMMLLALGISLLPCWMVLQKTMVFCILSCFTWSLPTVSWMIFKR